MDKKKLQKFLSKIEKDEETGCWNWIGFLTPDGYGRWGHERINRLSYEHYVGEIPKGMFICHKCIGNRRCANPDHLYAGTTQDNTRDRQNQGRQAFGERHRGHRKLTKENVEIIRYMFANKKRFEIDIKFLANSFSVTTDNIKHIIKGKTWKL